jgi:YD repeat-containing protein
MNRTLVVPILAASIGAAAAGEGQAADLPKEGMYDYMVCHTRAVSRIDYSANQFAYSYDKGGTALAKTPGSLFDDEAVHCVEFTLSLDGKRPGRSVCEGTAKDGDRRLTRFLYDAEGKLQREQVSGTGKYEGMTTTGSVRQVGATEKIDWNTAKYCNHATGTYKLK